MVADGDDCAATVVGAAAIPAIRRHTTGAVARARAFKGVEVIASPSMMPVWVSDQAHYTRSDFVNHADSFVRRGHHSCPAVQPDFDDWYRRNCPASSSALTLAVTSITNSSERGSASGRDARASALQLRDDRVRQRDRVGANLRQVVTRRRARRDRDLVGRGVCVEPMGVPEEGAIAADAGCGLE